MSGKAWILRTKSGQHAAVGARALVHVLPDRVDLYPIPGAPQYARHAIVWQESILPAVDIDGYDPNHGMSETGAAGAEVVVICAYLSRDGKESGLGALLLGAVPARADVADEYSCDLPRQCEHLSSISFSCFEHPDLGPVPVLDLQLIFARAADA